MSDEEFKIPAIKYYELHGLEKGHPYPSSNNKDSEFEFGSLPVFAWWRNRVEDLRQVQGLFRFPDPSAMLPVFPSHTFSLLRLAFVDPLVRRRILQWQGHGCRRILIRNRFRTHPGNPDFLRPVARDRPRAVFASLVLLSFGFCFFESLHHQRHFYEHPLMWMTGYMFIVAYEAGRTRSLLHAIVFCAIVHEAYNLAVTLLDPSLYPNPF